MLKRTFELFSGVKMTVLSGVFLAASLILMLFKTEITLDPAWLTVVICGYPLLYLAITRLFFNNGLSKISSALLITIAMSACIWLSFTPGMHDNIFAAGEVAFIMAIGAILEDKTVERAKKGIRKLISLAPEQGRRVTETGEEMIPADEILSGDILRVLPGESLPVDGVIILGNTSIDQSIITGESLPVDKTAGDNVFCGTINRFGSIDIKATRVGEDSSLQKLIRLVKEAEKNKAPMQRIVDKWAALLVPAALLIAVITYILTFDITRTVTVLVVFCPCALVLATPTSIMAAIGQAAKHGVIIKSGDALERMGKVDCVAFDKTGTLTHGRLEVSDIYALTHQIQANTKNSEKTANTVIGGADLLTLIASAEAHSEHPLGKAITIYAKEHGVTLRPASNFVMIPGKGISAVVDNKQILCGSSTYLEENGVMLDNEALCGLERFRNEGKAVVVASVDGKCAGIVALSDIIRPTAKDMVEKLRETNTDAILLTGDNRKTAEYFAGQAGINRVHAELLPSEKVEQIQKLQKEGRNICMIGDGVNDAPALKTADVGVAMGSIGSDIAIDAADIALMGDDITKIPYLKKLSNATVSLIKFNITLSMCINLVAIILSTLALLNPITGALVHNIGSVLVVLNAALLYDRKYT